MNHDALNAVVQQLGNSAFSKACAFLPEPDPEDEYWERWDTLSEDGQDDDDIPF